MAELALHAVKKHFGPVEVIPALDLHVNDGEFVVFVGPSGCGKSTLLRMIAGLEDVTDGNIVIDDTVVTDLPPAARGIAMVFQSYALYPHKDVYGNMAFALRHAGENKAVIDERVRHAADILGLEPLLKRKPKELSGGQRQRVAIGRAIVRDPKIFLFDEPLSNLDAALRVQMRVEILKLHKRLNNTMIYVTHDQVEAMTLADRIVVLQNGRIEQVGTPMELYHAPKNQFVAGFIGSPKMNFLSGTVISATDNSCVFEYQADQRLTLPISGKPGAATLGIRPEHLRLSATEVSGNATLSTELQVAERLGGETLLHMSVNGENSITAKVEGDPGLATDSSLSLSFSLSDAHLFDAEGQAYPKNI